jgi:3-dehydroquinate synthetase
LEKSLDEQHLLHGEAVGFGLVYALLLSQRVAGLSPQACGEMTSLVREVAGCLNRATLAHALGEPDLTAQHVFDRLRHFMGMDKKNLPDQETRWVLLSEMGQVFREGEAWTALVPSPVLREVWTHLLASLPNV